MPDELEGEELDWSSPIFAIMSVVRQARRTPGIPISLTHIPYGAASLHQALPTAGEWAKDLEFITNSEGEILIVYRGTEVSGTNSPATSPLRPTWFELLGEV